MHALAVGPADLKFVGISYKNPYKMIAFPKKLCYPFKLREFGI